MLVADKFRFRFRKDGALRFLSHHDLMRCSERMLRRANLPFKSTAGFHPTPRLVFALALPLGTVGANEVVELELLESRPADETLQTLQTQAPPGFQFLSVKAVPMKATALPRRAVYTLPLPEERREAAELAARDVITNTELWVERFKPKARRLNVRPYLRAIQFYGGLVEFDCWVTGFGTAKAEEIARAIGLGDHLDAGAHFERTELEIHDEITGDTADAPPTEPPLSFPIAHVPARAGDEENLSVSRTWASPNGPVTE